MMMITISSPLSGALATALAFLAQHAVSVCVLRLRNFDVKRLAIIYLK